MYVGALTLDILLGDVRSLKQKRSVVRPLVAELRRRFPAVAVAEVGHLDLHRRAEVGIAVISASAGNCKEVMDACERLVAFRPEIEALTSTDPATRGTPVVIMSSSDQQSDMLRSYERHANSYIVKPVDFKQFTDQVATLGKYWMAVNRVG